MPKPILLIIVFQGLIQGLEACYWPQKEACNILSADYADFRKLDIWIEYTVSISILRNSPVLDFEALYTLKMLFVIGDQGVVMGKGYRSNNQIEIIQSVARQFQV